MDKKQAELIRKVKSDLKGIEATFLRLKMLVNDLQEARSVGRGNSSKFAIKYFKRGDFN
ncbi:MAG: hypothetical protein H8E32_12800 [Nitrospinae bacterium]|nr:hypothetical protein [Nitrospinota bacterium]